jgi:lambda family phage minor tail protein L
MRTLASTVKTEKNKASNSPIFLYTIYNYDGANGNLYLAAYDTDVVFNAITYLKFPITHEAVNENSSGGIDTIKVSVANVNRIMQGYLEAVNFKGKQVDITTVFGGQLSNPSYKTVDTFYVDSYTADQAVVEFTLSSKFDVLDVNIPGRKFMRNFCQWKFKGTECGYSGGTTTCAKTKAACKALSNYVRFGGFPSVPQQQTYVQ